MGGESEVGGWVDVGSEVCEGMGGRVYVQILRGELYTRVPLMLLCFLFSLESP